MRLRIAPLARLAFWAALAFAYVCAIIPAAPEIGGSDKTTHMTAFATLALLARLGWVRARIWTIAGGLLLFGIAIEATQALPIVHRDAELGDVIADGCGIAAGLVVGWVARLIRMPD